MRLRRRYKVRLEDIQGNVLASYGNAYRKAGYAFMQVGAGDAGRTWLGGLAEKVTSALPWAPETRPSYTVNVSLSFAGLRALSLPEPLLETFPCDFREGMRERARGLGDKGPSDPEAWRAPWDLEPHVLVTLFAPDAEHLQQARNDALGDAGDFGVTMDHLQHAGLLGDPQNGEAAREHFGFADGFAQPTIWGKHAGPYSRKGGGTAKRLGRWQDLAAGEFVLGYPAEDGTHVVPTSQPLCSNGTFTVVRKLEQKVERFQEYMNRLSGGNPAREEWLAAGIVGRWRDGTPLMKSPNSPNPSVAADRRNPNGRANNFRYRRDPKGEMCPLGAHIRRANPRDAFGWQGRLTKRHRIIRRGMPYGPETGTGERGLMFVCHQASISRQFEVIQGQWLSDGDSFWLGDEPDLLASATHGHGMTLQGDPPVFLPRPEQPFVVTKGGGYFFTPGIQTLRRIAAGAWL